MWAVMICNAIISIGWIAAGVILILNNHPWWAGACLFGGLFSGYTYEKIPPNKATEADQK